MTTATTATTAANYTPGPWHRDPVTNNILTDPEDRESLIAAVRFMGGDNAEGDANALLIAAAPRLLEALRGLQKAVREAGLLNVKKYFDVCVADAEAGKAIHTAESRQ